MTCLVRYRVYAVGVPAGVGFPAVGFPAPPVWRKAPNSLNCRQSAGLRPVAGVLHRVDLPHRRPRTPDNELVRLQPYGTLRWRANVCDVDVGKALAKIVILTWLTLDRHSMTLRCRKEFMVTARHSTEWTKGFALTSLSSHTTFPAIPQSTCHIVSRCLLTVWSRLVSSYTTRSIRETHGHLRSVLHNHNSL